MFEDEARRLNALRALALLDSEPEREFDVLVSLACDMLKCDIALITLVDEDRVWIKAATGRDRGELGRERSMCDYTIRGSEPLAIQDLAGDARFTENPLVAVDGARFYAGAPIHVVDEQGRRHAIGTLCVIDPTPRTLDDVGRRALVHLATLAESTIAARTAASSALAIAVTADRQSAALARQDRIFRQAERMAAIGSWRSSLIDHRLEWSDGVYHIHGMPAGTVPDIADAMAFYPPPARKLVAAALDQTIETGVPFDIEVDFMTAGGDPRRVRVLGELEQADGNPIALVGVFQDVTERHALEVTLRRTADTDSLTGIANRSAFDRAIEAAIARAHDQDTRLLLVLVDLDDFKKLNDTLGHMAGDDVLRGVGQVLREPWLKGSFAARLGGDEFGMLIEDPTLTAAPDEIRARLENALRFPIALDGLAMISAGTVGIVALEPGCRSVRDFVHRGDTVLYQSKRARLGRRRRTDRRSAA